MKRKPALVIAHRNAPTHKCHDCGRTIPDDKPYVVSWEGGREVRYCGDCDSGLDF